MPPKRNSQGAKSSIVKNGEPPEKQARVLDTVDDSSPGISANNLSWEFENKKKWVTYPPNVVEALNKATAAKCGSLFLESDGKKFAVEFSRMKQKNEKTGWETCVRCCVKEAGHPDYYAWEWKEQKDCWTSFSPEVVLHLEKAYSANAEDLDIETNGTFYKIDLTLMEQMSETDENFKRKVRRVKSETPAFSKHNKAAASISVCKVENHKNEPVDTVKKVKAAASKKKDVKRVEVNEGGDAEVRTLLLKGKAPVDPECPKLGKAHVYFESDDVWDCMLNQTNLQFNNNKYYVIQLLEDDNSRRYAVWMRWGRVGYKGQNTLISCGPELEEAKKVFKKKFSDKTKNQWEDRKSFTKVPGKYDLVAVDYSADSAKDETDSKGSQKKLKPIEKLPEIQESKLDQRTQALIELICDIQAMEEAVIEMQYDTKKAPLGKLTADQIKAGYEALKRVSEYLSNNRTGKELVLACNDFYTRIPHDFGMRVPPVIRTMADVRVKLQMLEALGNIQVALKFLKDEGDSLLHPVDRQYMSLKCDIKPLDKNTEEFKLIEEYVQTTHAKTHNQYKMEVLNIFECTKDTENQQFLNSENHMLLWHGSRLTNWAGILSQGLKIAPPEAPSTGYMFGKGIYFADMSSKSANYCFPTRTKNVGLLLLCDVSLGNASELLDADCKADRLPKGKDSVKGLGMISPDTCNQKSLPDGTVIPMGPGISTGVKNPRGYTLNYNEYVVYNRNQVKMKYLVQIKFHFK